MAKAPGHKLGQRIGEAIETALQPSLRAFADTHGLYLDVAGERKPARKGKKVRWKDEYGNSHDLDFVLERGGSAAEVGTPVAFIEVAWRRYTKHSKNKAQEIQGAVAPLLDLHFDVHPLAAAVIAGEWTASSQTQLRSLGFYVVHIPTQEVVDAFATIGMDIAQAEGASDDEAQAQVDKYDALTADQHDALGAEIRACAPEEFKSLLDRLEAAVTRSVSRVVVLPLRGNGIECTTIDNAVHTIAEYVPDVENPAFVRWEISVRFSNDDRIDAEFTEAEDAIAFLRTFT